MTHGSLFILGRQPALGRAELESILGAATLESIGDQAMACSVAADDIPFHRLGGSVRLAKPLTMLDTTNWTDIQRYCKETLPHHLDMVPEGKLKLGLSVYGLPVDSRQLLRTGLELKKVCKKAGRSVRIVPNDASELSSAQVLHNQLTGELGMELLFIRHGARTYLAQTLTVQDITAYAKRDQGRPKRDARVGMLPPKLAQIIVNLATGTLAADPQTVVLDPFCGTGVVLQESLLMGYGAYGTDIEPRMIDYTGQNLTWLASHADVPSPTLEAGDATSHQWAHPFSVVASETYLGRPLSSWPNSETLHTIIGTCNVIIDHFLRNMATQSKPGQRLCLAVPAWRAPDGRFHHLPLLDHLGEIGYNRLRFEHVQAADLVYFRPEQLVARELLVIIKQ